MNRLCIGKLVQNLSCNDHSQMLFYKPHTTLTEALTKRKINNKNVCSRSFNFQVLQSKHTYISLWYDITSSLRNLISADSAPIGCLESQSQIAYSSYLPFGWLTCFSLTVKVRNYKKIHNCHHRLLLKIVDTKIFNLAKILN